MSSSAAPPPGAADAPSTLRAYLARADHADVASMDEARFASWLAAEARARVLSDPGASLRAYARALRAHHAPTLDPLDASRATATDAYRAHPASARVERAERHLAHLRAAVVGIEAYLRTLDPAGPGGGENAEAKAARTRRKLDATRALVPAAEAEANAARDDAAPLLRDCRRTAEALASARDATGVALAERDAADAMRRAGARNVERGSGFEDVAAGVMRDAVEKAAGFGFGFGLAGAGVSAGGVSADESDADGGCSSSARLFLLRNVTLGSANFELDAVLVRATPEAGSREDGGASASGSVSDKASASSRNVFRRVVSDALAVFECKRGPDDIARGFEARQASLEWLAGGPGYDPDEWRNRRHPTGRFEGGAHFEKSRGETFAFAPGSFRRFKRDYACAETDRRFFVRGLWFVTRPVAMDGLDVKVRTKRASDEPPGFFFFPPLPVFVPLSRGGRIWDARASGPPGSGGMRAPFIVPPRSTRGTPRRARGEPHPPRSTFSRPTSKTSATTYESSSLSRPPPYETLTSSPPCAPSFVRFARLCWTPLATRSARLSSPRCARREGRTRPRLRRRRSSSGLFASRQAAPPSRRRFSPARANYARGFAGRSERRAIADPGPRERSWRCTSSTRGGGARSRSFSCAATRRRRARAQRA